MRQRYGNTYTGFTLAELLIALAILGVIATFSIPKVLMAQQDQKYNAIAKEAAAMISGAYQAYQNGNTATSSTKAEDLTPFMNFIKTQTVDIDNDYNSPTVNYDCSTDTCLKLHSGAVMRYKANVSFSGTGATNAINFVLDPDGVITDGTTTCSGRSVRFFLYFNGRMASYATIASNTVSSDGTRSALARDPSWFTWN